MRHLDSKPFIWTQHPSPKANMEAEYETGRSNLLALAKYYAQESADRNEATTRIQLIDRIFFDCLGWSKETDYESEQSQDGQYADYTFLHPRRILIVEAKREGEYFDLPAGGKNLYIKIASLCRDNGQLEKAIEQAMGYCQRRGAPIGVVANGHQLVAFIAVRTDGVAPMAGRALVFESFDAMVSEYFPLWQALSRPGIAEGHLSKELLGGSIAELPPRLATRIHGYPGIKARNIFQTDMQIISELVIDDVVKAPQLETQFLTDCYCDSGALTQNSLVSKTILENRYAALYESNQGGPTLVPATSKKGISSELIADSLSRRPILLIGDVGVGKTMFINHLIRVAAVETFTNALEFHLDLGFGATLSVTVREFILLKIVEQLELKHAVDPYDRNFVYGVYDLDLKKFSKGIYGELGPDQFKEKKIDFLDSLIRDKSNHLKRVLNHLAKARKKQIVIFIDNCDQRDDSIQQQSFLVAQELASSWSATVFVTLRPETFYRSQKSGALTGYHPKAFTISPPRVNLVIEKRLVFALKITSGQVPLTALERGNSLTLSSLQDLITVFLKSLNNSRPLQECLDNVSGGNVRLALDMVKEFFGSGHVDTQKIVDIYRRESRYQIPEHEFLRAVIYRDSQHYNPDESPVANIYNVSHSDPKEHFLTPILIGLLLNASGPEIVDGFVETPLMYSQLQSLGFTPDQIDAAVLRAHGAKLIVTSGRIAPGCGEAAPLSLCATSVGAFHTRRLASMFAYIDAVIVDTPIFEKAARAKIVDAHNIQTRLHRGGVFCQYLDEQWKALSNAEGWFPWPEISTQIKNDMDRVSARVASMGSMRA